MCFFIRLEQSVLCRLRSIAAHRDHFVRRLSVCACVCLSDSHTFLIVTHSYVSQATHAFLGMLPLCLFLISCNGPFNRAIIQLSNCPLEVKCIYSPNTSSRGFYNMRENRIHNLNKFNKGTEQV